MFCSKPGPSSAGSSGFLVPVCAVGRGGPHPLPGGLWSSGRKGGGSAGPTSAVSLASAPRPRLRLEAQPYAPGEKVSIPKSHFRKPRLQAKRVLFEKTVEPGMVLGFRY